MNKLLLINNQNKLSSAFNKFVDTCKTEVCIVNYTDIVKNITSLLENCSGIIFTGTDIPPAGNIKYYGTEIQIILQAKVPILGICGGAQIINLAYGGTLKECAKGYCGKQLTKLKNDEIFIGLKDLSYFFVRHKWIIKDVADQFHPIAFHAEEGMVYAIKHNFKSIYGCQFHPERRSDGLKVLHNFIEIVKRAYSNDRKNKNF